jgi:hypothetical protein
MGPSRPLPCENHGDILRRLNNLEAEDKILHGRATENAKAIARIEGKIIVASIVGGGVVSLLTWALGKV